LWEDARKILKTVSDVNRELYWTLCFDELARFEDERLLVCDGFTSSVIEKCISPVDIVTGQATKTGNISFECPTFVKYTAVEDYAMSIMGNRQNLNGALLFVKVRKSDLEVNSN
jgi:U3 small nucleolar RNA-associated protein 20